MNVGLLAVIDERLYLLQLGAGKINEGILGCSSGRSAEAAKQLLKNHLTLWRM